MGNFIEILIYLLLSGGVGFSTMFFILKNKKLFDFEKKEQKAKELLDENKEKASQVLEETKERMNKSRQNFEESVKRREFRIGKINGSMSIKEKMVARKEEKNKTLKLQIASEKEEQQSKQSKIKKNEEEIIQKLSQATGETK
ncbi:hypothetical protein KJ632_02620, partial [Patescibacteria group bacterium]|nr:hypothetical protein [Patescibacteria group bacterium]